MADPNVFAQYMQRPKSVMEYMAEADEQDMQRRRNALEELAMQDKMTARQQAGVDRQWFEQIARQSGGDQKRLVQELRASGRMPLVQQAGQMEKEALEVEAKGADVAAKQYELERKKYTDSVQQLLAFTSPDDAISDLQGAVQRGDVKPEQAEQMLASMPRDQGQFLQWRSQTLLGLVSAKDRMEQEFKDRQLAQQKADAEAGRRVTMRGQDLVDRRARETADRPTYSAEAGGFIDPRTQTITPAKTPAGPPVVSKKEAEEQRGRTRDATEAIALVDQAEALVRDGATGSFIGAAMDWAQQAYGGSNRGANNAAKLRALEGLLVSKMPKMSGPQSDKDVQLYRQMAGEIGDPTVPEERKLAALEVIREIQERYAGMAPGSSKKRGPTLQMPADPNAGAMNVIDFGSLK